MFSYFSIRSIMLVIIFIRRPFWGGFCTRIGYSAYGPEVAQSHNNPTTILQQSPEQSPASSIDNILGRIEPHCFDLDEKRINKGQLLFFSFPEIIDPRHYQFSNMSVFSIHSSFDSASISLFEEDGSKLSFRHQESFDSDPRHVLGRFTSMVSELSASQRRNLALMLMKISEYNPSKIFYSSQFSETPVACKILGYGEERVFLVSNDEV